MLPPPAGGSSGYSHTCRTTNSAPCAAASAAAQANAVRLPRDPSTPTRMVFHVLTVVSSSSVDAPALLNALSSSQTLIRGVRPVEGRRPPCSRGLRGTYRQRLRVAYGGSIVPNQYHITLVRRRGRHRPNPPQHPL